ncbi:hypothetical protein Namu_4482 [Nakamurella multipartita DSM 44233]|uniref:Polysaccharide pyruvyl transferase domain-containing protein n=2 Tax=Nakamurella TaxID=53460 RepID=C8XKV8_NAKMY|nr:hypothetical protein Namu_4482 [Nakamurella multipartita DSM 44233]
MSVVKLVLAGAPLSNGNRGVQALGRSVVGGIDDWASRAGEQALVAMLDDGWGVRRSDEVWHGHTVVEAVGVRRSRRLHRPESWARVRWDQALGSGGNHVAIRLARANAVLDISGGDSFTDMYGWDRLASVSAPKEAALRVGTPLVLMPQTYGPFDTAAGRRKAERLVRGAALAYSRDPRSHVRLLELAGRGVDHARCRSGVDVAFALPSQRPDLDSRLEASLSDETIVRVGINVSGLLSTPEGQRQFRILGDYISVFVMLVRKLIADGVVIVFVPHVHRADGSGESDMNAINAVSAQLTPTERERVVTLPAILDAAELKWCISRLDWLVGSRMHATIAGLSQQIPTFGFAYSDKSGGVFQTCGLASEIADARSAEGEEAVRLMLDAFARRELTREILARSAPPVVQRARDQMTDILGAVHSWTMGVIPGTIA